MEKEQKFDYNVNYIIIVIMKVPKDVPGAYLLN